MESNLVSKDQDKAERSLPEPKMPPEAIKSSGPQEDPSVPGPGENIRRKHRRREFLEGSTRIVCRRCKGFLAEVKSQDFEAVFFCPRCKMENMISIKKL
jgi:hypothetical protein